MASKEDMRYIVFEYLHACDDLDDVSWKQVRKHVERKLNVEKGTLKESKVAIKELISDYQGIKDMPFTEAPFKPVVVQTQKPAPSSSSKQTAAILPPTNPTPSTAVVTTIDVPKLRRVLFEWLASSDNVERLTLKDAREHLEISFGVAAGSFKEQKIVILEAINDYRIQHMGNMDDEGDKDEEEEDEDDDEDNVTGKVLNPDEVKLWKYSKKESKMIMNATNDYVQRVGSTVEELSNALSDTEEKRKRFRDLWLELGRLIPNRSAQSIYEHVQLKLYRKSKGSRPWLTSDVEVLKQHVQTYGQRWKHISKLMDRFAQDCKHVYERHRTRTHTGRYTIDEDRRLFLAVHKALEYVPHSYDPAARHQAGKSCKLKIHDDFPTSNIPWEAVAILMNHERRGIDYLRRWPRIRVHFNVKSTLVNSYINRPADVSDAIESDGTTVVTMTVADRDPNSATPYQSRTTDALFDTDLKMLEVLEELDPDDESEIIWKNIDRQSGVIGVGRSAAMRWKSIVKLHCTHINGKNSFGKCLKYLLAKYRAESIKK